jgi:OOP family OmpA-OmpF porin
MAMKKLFAVLAISLSLSILSAAALAEGDGFVEDYVGNSYGEIWKNSYGECWRNSYQTGEKKEECGYETETAVVEVEEVVEVVMEEPPACPDAIVLEDLRFGFDSDAVSSEDKDMLMKARDFIRAEVPEGCTKTAEVNVIGHTDSVGPEAYNQGLSERRAQAVVDYLRSMGVQVPLNAMGKGESEPVADNSTKEGRAKNRRVVIDINIDN